MSYVNIEVLFQTAVAWRTSRPAVYACGGGGRGAAAHDYQEHAGDNVEHWLRAGRIALLAGCMFAGTAVGPALAQDGSEEVWLSVPDIIANIYEEHNSGCSGGCEVQYDYANEVVWLVAGDNYEPAPPPPDETAYGG